MGDAQEWGQDVVLNIVVLGWVMARSGARIVDGKRTCQDVVVLGWVMARNGARMLW